MSIQTNYTILTRINLSDGVSSLKFNITNSVEFPYSYILFLKDLGQSEFVLKQIKNFSNEEQIQVVSELVACEMASDLNISAPSTTLITKEQWQDLKPLKDAPALLFSKAKGVVLEDSSLWQDLEIAQRARPIDSPQYKKYGPLPKAREGLTLAVLENMSRHVDLPPIVAIDTFVGNRDRFENNLFYNIEQDKFTAIDFGESFKLCLMVSAKENLSKLLTLDYHCSPSFIESLNVYLETLINLREKWPEKKILDRLETYCAKLDFDFNQSNKMHSYKENIQKTFENIDDVISSMKAWIQNLKMKNPYVMSSVYKNSGI